MGDVLDLGTGTALIPLILCELDLTCRIIATDMATSMLDLAVYNIALSDVPNVSGRIQLAHADAKALDYADEMFDSVISNTILHHIPDPMACLQEAVRVCAEDGIIFFRDLLRPDSEAEVTQLVRLTHTVRTIASATVRRFPACRADTGRNPRAGLATRF